MKSYITSHRQIWTLLLAGMMTTCLVLLAGPATADDTSVTAALLHDEGAECTYLLSLCTQHRRQKAHCRQEVLKFEQITQELQKAKESAFTYIPPQGLQNMLDEGTKEQAVTTVCLAEMQKMSEASISAATVIRAKHTHMPTCFIGCHDVLNLEKFR